MHRKPKLLGQLIELSQKMKLNSLKVINILSSYYIQYLVFIQTSLSNLFIICCQVCRAGPKVSLKRRPPHRIVGALIFNFLSNDNEINEPIWTIWFTGEINMNPSSIHHIPTFFFYYMLRHGPVDQWTMDHGGLVAQIILRQIDKIERTKQRIGWFV